MKIGKFFVLFVLLVFGCAEEGPTMNQFDGQGIIGGRTVDARERIGKHIAGLLDVSTEASCTATILTNSVLLTAAHCVESETKNLYVIFGTRFDETAQVRQVTKVVISPKWTGGLRSDYNWGDIALVKFSGGLPLGYKQTKVLSQLSPLQDGARVTLAGYGVNDPWNGEGGGRLRRVETTIDRVGFTRTEISINQRDGRGACYGDSGGPAFIKIKGEFVVFGVTSRGAEDPYGTCRNLGVYTSVVAYLDWIIEQANRL